MANGVLGFFFFTIIGVVTGISVGPVRLIHDKPYFVYRKEPSSNLTVIECPIELLADEELQEVSWTFSEDLHKEVGHYVWTLELGGRADGRLDGVVELDRSDGDLELTELRYNLAGYYSCSATTKDGTTAEAAKWEVLILDTTDNHFESHIGFAGPSIFEGSCQLKSSFRFSAIYPEPTAHTGLYSESYGGFVEEVKAIDWLKQKYPNNSYSYSYEDFIFEVDVDTPFDVYLLTTVGITKTDGTYFHLYKSNTTWPEASKRGCPMIKNGTYQTIHYDSNKKTCHKEMRAWDFFGDKLVATVGCIDGYRREGEGYKEGEFDYGGDGDYETVELTCSQPNWTWVMPNSIPDFHAFKCVEKRGCPIIKNSTGQTIDYSSNQRNSLDEVIPLGSEEPLQATVRCIDGYRFEGDLHRYSLVLTCNKEKWTWVKSNNKPNLPPYKCVGGSAFTASGSSVLVMACLLLLRLLQQ